MKHTWLGTNHAVVRLCSLFVALLVSYTSVYALQTTVLLQGKILGDKGRVPIAAARYVIETSSGKKIKGTSSTDGSFKQVLQSGENYTVTFTAYNILKTTAEFSLPAADKYQEEPRDFVVPVLQKGDNLLSLAAFEQGRATLSADARVGLEKVAAMLKDNRGLSIAITVSGDAVKTTAKKSSKKSKKKKGKAEEEAEAAPSGSSAIAQARIDAVNAALQQIDASVVKRITVMQATTPSSAGVTLVAVIEEVKDMFK